jgi:formylglycine-generating enzyme required for sulfatase activity
MAAKIFISYRRGDAAGYAGRIHDRLEREFDLFMDVDAIPLGVNFVNFLCEEVAKCDWLLAIIGSGWLDARDDDGNRRLDNPHDFIRIEIAAALKREIPVIPILLDGARLPKADQLPDDLRQLVLWNGLDVRHASFHTDMDKLVRDLRGREPVQQPTPATAAVTVRADGRMKVDASIVHGAPDGWFRPGNGQVEWFQDYEGGPEMVVVPAGSFMMGSPETELGQPVERPQHPVTIAGPFAIGRHAVTRCQFAAFVNNTGHRTEGGAHVREGSEWVNDPRASWRDPGFTQDDSHPVVSVSWQDAKAFAAWLSNQSGRVYRLLTEAEWEYAARAGTTTPFWWGSTITSAQANYDGNYVYGNSGTKGEYRKQTVPVGSFATNPWGLYQVHGNVWEWCEDVFHFGYNGAPADGSAWLESRDAAERVVRGGSWLRFPEYLRSAARGKLTPDSRFSGVGFRVARTLTP